MKRLLLLALPALLAGCPSKDPTKDATATATAPAAPAAPAAAAAATAPAEPADASKPAPAAATASADFANVAVIRASATLPRHLWRLADATDSKGQRIETLFVRPSQPVTLAFGGGQLVVSNTCNRMAGSYSLGGKSVTVAKLGATKKACADAGLMALDAEAGRRLEGKLAVRMSKQQPLRLELRNASGDVLVLDSAPLAATPATK